MVQIGNILCTAEFDSGNFLGGFAVELAQSESYDYYDTNMKEVYKLDSEDFRKLEGLIAAVVNNYIDLKSEG
jgi:hypothetical protein